MSANIRHWMQALSIPEPMKIPKRILFALFLLVAIGFALNWGIWNTEKPKKSSERPAGVKVSSQVPGTLESAPPETPVLVSGGVFLDNSTTIDGQTGLGSYEVGLQSGGQTMTFPVQAAYKKYVRHMRMEVAIAALYMGDLGFTESYSRELPSSRPDIKLRVHFGDFAQDFCGDIAVIYTAETDNILMATPGNTAATAKLLADTGCTLKAQKSFADGFCERRLNCLAEQLSQTVTPDLAEELPAKALLQLVLK